MIIVTATLVGLGLTAVALFLSIVQHRQSKKHAHRLGLISESMSTKFLGNFPDYLGPLVDVIEKAEQELVVVCTIPAHGSYSDNKWYLRYRQAIEAKILDGVDVVMLTSNAEARERLLDEQFAQALHHWDDWFAEHENKAKEVLVSGYCSEDDFAALNFDEFKRCLERTNFEALHALRTAKSLEEYDDLLHLWVWVIDQREAVFVLPSFASGTRGGLRRAYGFRTLDQRLVNSLLDVARFLRTRSKPAHLPGEVPSA